MTAYVCDYPACLCRGCDKACNAALPPKTRSQKLAEAGFTPRKRIVGPGGLALESDDDSSEPSGSDSTGGTTE